MTVIVDLFRALSEGQVTLNRTNALTQPNINLNFFGNDLDILAMREGVRWTYDVLTKGAGFKDLVISEYPWKMPPESDDGMKRAVLDRSQTGFRKLCSRHISTYKCANTFFQIFVLLPAFPRTSNRALLTPSFVSTESRISTLHVQMLPLSLLFLIAISRTPST